MEVVRYRLGETHAQSFADVRLSVRILSMSFDPQNRVMAYRIGASRFATLWNSPMRGVPGGIPVFPAYVDDE